MKRKNGFTLVELLVVIGIIAVLISILLPSLNRARESAKRIKCAAQLRQVGVAARAYAADNKDLLPPMNQDRGQIDYHMDLAGSVNFQRTVSYHIWLNSQTASPPATDPAYVAGKSYRPAIGSNIGRLYNRKYLTGDFIQITSCPSTEPYGADSANNPTSYVFNPHIAVRTVIVNGAPQDLRQPWWKRISQYGRVPRRQIPAYGVGGTSGSSGLLAGVYVTPDREYALGSDPLTVPGSVPIPGFTPHAIGTGRAYNLLYSDGSVKTAVVPNKFARGNTGSVGPILDALGQAESIASGKAVEASNSVYVRVPYNP